MRTWAPSVRTLLAGVFAVVLVLPVLAFGVARLYDDLLIRQTEEALIAESVIVGEVYRRLLDPDAAARPLELPDDPDAERYFPFAPQLSLRGASLLPEAERPPVFVAASSTLGEALARILERAQVRNLSGVRVLDAQGVVVASPAGVVGYPLAHLEEVQAALRGDYGASLRRRKTDAVEPPLSSISRASTLRVSIAVPVFEDPLARPGTGAKVIGAVYDNRTPLALRKALYLLRRELVAPVALTFAIAAAIVLALGALIARPLRSLGDAAERVAAGASGVSLHSERFAPSEVHQLAQALDSMRAQLTARAAYVREFAANAVHELKSPLTSLRGASELLLDNPDMADEQARRFLENIHQDAIRMDALVQRLLLLARIESQAIVKEELDLRAFLDALKERYARRGTEVKVDYGASSPVAQASPELIDSMLTNLVDNAARHGAGRPIEIAVRDEGARKRIEVRDHGPPIDAEAFARLFQRFHTTQRQKGGTGLGLAIVKAAAEAHGGSARARRHEDGGLTVEVEI